MLPTTGAAEAPPVLRDMSLLRASALAWAARISLRKAAFALTVLYGGTLFWLAPYPPMADLPQYAGQVALLRDLVLGQSPWEPLLRINYFTPYLIGYAAALPLTFLMPVAAALKLLLTAAFVGFVCGCLLLRRHFGADERLDWLFIPGFFGFAWVYGFFTFLLAAPLGLLFIWLADQHAMRRSAASALRLAFAGITLFFAHGLVFAVACAVGGVLALVRNREWKSRLAVLAAYAPLAALSLAYVLVARHDEAAVANGIADTVWRAWGNRLYFLAYIYGYWYDVFDATFAAVAGVVMLWAPRLLGSSLNRAQPASFVPLAVLVVVWAVAPYYAMKTTFVYHRFALFILPFYALAFRRPSSTSDGSPAKVTRSRACEAMLAALCLVFLTVETAGVLRFARESKDFDVVRAAAEPGHRALSLIFEPGSAAARSRVAYLHFPLWYQAENKGFVDLNFAWASSLLVRFRADQTPAVQLFWDPASFHWDRHGGGQYRYFFVRQANPVPAALFANDQCEVSLVKAAGLWSLYEAKRCSGAVFQPTP